MNTHRQQIIAWLGWHQNYKSVSNKNLYYKRKTYSSLATPQHIQIKSQYGQT